MDEASGHIVDSVIKLLLKYPLCDNCLGRMYARLGYGLTNRERGRALKVTALLEAHRRYTRGEMPAEEFRVLCRNIGSLAKPLYEKTFGESLEDFPKCYICGGSLQAFIEEAAKRAVGLLKAYDIERFVVGVRVPRPIIDKEDMIKAEFQLEYGESIKAELRREIGKKIQEYGYTVDFEDPEATVLVEYPSGAIWLQVNSLLIAGRYWKLGRLISQAYWPTADGPKYYSIEQALWSLLKVTGGERVILHAAGREDVDARMLGTGRPMIVEVKMPRRRHIPLSELERVANTSSDRVRVKFEGVARRHDIVRYKSEDSRKEKTYKALIVLSEPLVEDKLQELEEFFRNRIILQRTPSRVLHRRPDILRRRRVFSVKCRKYTSKVIECMITSEGGLYIKELVSGDQGRTTPSFKEVLGFGARCVELDVIGVRI
jgi:tRNA pseudouridine synthase 10